MACTSRFYVLCNRLLRKGSYGTVVFAKDLESSEVPPPVVAIKLYKDRSLRDHTIQVLQELSDPSYVVQLAGDPSQCVLDGTPAEIGLPDRLGAPSGEVLHVIVLQKADQSLKDVLLHPPRKGIPLDIRDAIHRMHCICKAVEYIHSKMWVHGDLKPENILEVREPWGYTYKLVDLDFSRRAKEELPASSPTICPPEAAAALAEGMPATATFALDTWALGCILYEMLTGSVLLEAIKPSIRGKSGQEQFQGAASLRQPDLDGHCEALEASWIRKAPSFLNALSLLRKLLKVNPEERLSASEALMHPFFEGGTTATYDVGSLSCRSSMAHQGQSRASAAQKASWEENVPGSSYELLHPLRRLVSKDVRLQRQAAEALRKVAWTNSVTKTLTTTMASDCSQCTRYIQPLVGCLDNDDVEVQREAARALGFLSNTANSRRAIVNASGLEPLVRLLSSPDADVQRFAASVLGNLAIYTEGCGESIALMVGVKLLVTELLQSSETEVQKLAARLLGCKWDPYEAAAGIQRLAELLCSGDTEVQCLAARVLTRLAESPCVAVQADITRAVGIQTLVELLGSRFSEVRVLTIKLLLSLDVNEVNVAQIAEALGVETLVKLLHNRNVKIQSLAAAALDWLADGEAKSSHVAKNVGTQPLVELLSHGDPLVRRLAARLLQSLAGDEAKLIAIAEAAGVKALANLLCTTVDVEKQRLAARVIMRLANEAKMVDVAEAVGVKPLVELLGNQCSEVVGLAATALGCLADRREDHKSAISQAGGIQLLVGLLSSPETAVLRAAARALRILAWNHCNNSIAIGKEGGVKALVKLLGSPDTVVQREATGALWQLVSYGNNSAIIAEAGGAQPLEGLKSSPDAAASQMACLTLGFLMHSKANMAIRDAL